MTTPKTPSTVDWDRLRTALDGLSPEELNGLAAGTHVVVPIVPNEAMLRNALPYLCHSYARGAWKAMIEARNRP